MIRSSASSGEKIPLRRTARPPCPYCDPPCPEGLPDGRRPSRARAQPLTMRSSALFAVAAACFAALAAAAPTHDEELAQAIKHSEIGHAVYEVLRKAGYGNRIEFTGGFSAGLEQAVASGRALKLTLSSTMWNDEFEAAGLEAALASSTCRVDEITAVALNGDAKVAVLTAVCLGPTVRKAK